MTDPLSRCPGAYLSLLGLGSDLVRMSCQNTDNVAFDVNIHSQVTVNGSGLGLAPSPELIACLSPQLNADVHYIGVDEIGALTVHVGDLTLLVPPDEHEEAWDVCAEWEWTISSPGGELLIFSSDQ